MCFFTIDTTNFKRWWILSYTRKESIHNDITHSLKRLHCYNDDSNGGMITWIISIYKFIYYISCISCYTNVSCGLSHIYIFKNIMLSKYYCTLVLEALCALRAQYIYHILIKLIQTLNTSNKFYLKYLIIIIIIIYFILLI